MVTQLTDMMTGYIGIYFEPCEQLQLSVMSIFNDNPSLSPR